MMMQAVASHKAENKMSSSAVSACMAPLLLRALFLGECEIENDFDTGGDNDSVCEEGSTLGSISGYLGHTDSMSSIPSSAGGVTAESNAKIDESVLKLLEQRYGLAQKEIQNISTLEPNKDLV